MPFVCEASFYSATMSLLSGYLHEPNPSISSAIWGWARVGGSVRGCAMRCANRCSEGKVSALDAGADDYVTKPFGVGAPTPPAPAGGRRHSAAATPASVAS